MFWKKKKDPLLQLTSRLRRAVQATNDDAIIAELAAEKLDLSPWATWALLGLVRHRERQRWVTNIVRTRLQGSPEELQVAGAFAHPGELPQQGIVPGLIEWEYYFHGIGCCLTHRTNGESIDVDFYDETGDYIDVWFYLNYLKSLKHPPYSEQRLIELHPSYSPLRIAFEQLKSNGAMLQFPERKVFKLSAACNELSDTTDQFFKLCDDPTRRLLVSAAVGDWLKADESLGHRWPARDSERPSQ